jgi:hypothetical protein
MGKPRKTRRRPDLRRIRPTKAYSTAELARALDRRADTVQRWIARGMPTIDGTRPRLIFGGDALAWLKERWNNAARKCGPAEFYCLCCREPRRAVSASVTVLPLNRKSVRVSGLCECCNTQVNRIDKAANAGLWRAPLQAIRTENDTLRGSDNLFDKALPGGRSRARSR